MSQQLSAINRKTTVQSQGADMHLTTAKFQPMTGAY
jgi:hypothetical protein